jgi:hypothetical protein
MIVIGMRVLLLAGLVMGLLGCARAQVGLGCSDGGCRQEDAGDGYQEDATGPGPVCPAPAECNPEALCTATTCGSTGWTCGVESGWNRWTTGVAACDDGDPCTLTDYCEYEGCIGTRKQCATPPPAECLDASTLRTYSAVGSCVDGECLYESTDLTCPASDCVGDTCGADPCGGTFCDSPPDLCHEAPGACSAGTCVYPEKTLDCSRPHTTGGACQPDTGECGGWACTGDYANCNGGWDDGCETYVRSANNCGDCGVPCTTSGAHMTADCATGTCVIGCESPWADCNADPADGCEIPVGVSSRCDKAGLNAQLGCGTAYCGSSTAPYTTNFTGWYCVFCSHCHAVTGGDTWCLYKNAANTGQWSPDPPCTGCCLPAQHDLVCGP